jgi:hypothetical protein
MIEPYDCRSEETSRWLATLPWRIGGSVGRTIYARAAGGPTEHARDQETYLIGLMDSALLAQAACDAHNALIDGTQT